jgi:hypothetical protein
MVLYKYGKHYEDYIFMPLAIQNAVEIEYTINIDSAYSMYLTPVWRFLIWIKGGYKKYLPFMADTDTNYVGYKLTISNVYIDNEVYVEMPSMNDVLATQKSYYLFENNVYIHFPNHYPPFVNLTLQAGALIGYTDRSVIQNEEGIVYQHKVLSLPSIEEKADSLSYGKMVFNSGTVVFDNSKGEFDNLTNIFGNQVNLLSGKTTDTGGANQGLNNYTNLKKIIQYYIANMTLTKEKMTLSLKDKRQREAFKAPLEVYDVAEYPFMATPGATIYDKVYGPQKSRDVGKVKQNAYGHCFEVPGVCIDPYKVYTTPGNENGYRRFRFANKITTPELLEAKMTGDVWRKVDDYDWTSGPTDGTINIPYRFVYPPLSNGNPDPGQGIYDVRLTGYFSPQPAIAGIPDNSPASIILALFNDYGQLPPVEKYFNLAEMVKEMGRLSEVGLVLNKSSDIYDWVEQLQNSSYVGFKFYSSFDKYSCRLDYSNRPESFDINSAEILNKNEIELDFNAENYATIAKIYYLYKAQSDNYECVINRDYETEILNTHRTPKEYGEEAKTLITTKNIAERKAEIVMNEYRKLQPILKNVKLFGEKWMDVQFYDTGYIDLSETKYRNNGVLVHLMATVNKKGTKGYNELMQNVNDSVVLIDGTTKDHTELAINSSAPSIDSREFVGRVRVKVLRKSVDLSNYEFSMDLQVCDLNPVYDTIGGMLS